jgi:tetratricopeptide (TPR) repeat protein
MLPTFSSTLRFVCLPGITGLTVLLGCSEPTVTQSSPESPAAVLPIGGTRDEQLQPTSADSNRKVDFVKRGIENLKSGCPDTAVRDFCEAIHKHPDAETYYNRAQAYMALGWTRAAQQDCTESLHLSPRSAKVHHLRGLAYLRGREFERATSDLNLALELDASLNGELQSARAEAAWGYAELLERQGPSAKAAEYRGLASQLNPELAVDRRQPGVATDAMVHYNQGRDLFQAQDYRGAIDQFTSAIAADRRWGPAYLARGIAFLEQGSIDTALCDLNMAVTMGRPSADIYYQLARANAILGRPIAVIQHATDAIRLQPNMAEAHLLRAQAYLNSNTWGLAAVDLDNARTYDPNLGRVVLELLARASKSDSFSGAMAEYARWQETDPALAVRLEKILAEAREFQSRRDYALWKPIIPDNEKARADALAADHNAVRLQQVLDFARHANEQINREVDDYTCILMKRERVNGRLGECQFMQAKIRHEKKQGNTVVVPSSVFVRFLQPAPMEGLEVLFVQNRDDGDLTARRGWYRLPNTPLRLRADSPLNMDMNHYPIAEIGFQSRIARLITVLEEEQKHNDGVVDIFSHATVNGRDCTHYRLTHAQPRPGLTYQTAELWVDNELQVPIYFRSYCWPLNEDEEPSLLEEYYYGHVQLNVGLTDEDFDPENSDYHFQSANAGQALVNNLNQQREEKTP